MPTTLPIEEILAGSAPPAHLEEIGRSRDGRPIGAWRGGRGPLSVSLVAGCHADEPVGPTTLRGLSGWLATRPEHDPAVAEANARALEQLMAAVDSTSAAMRTASTGDWYDVSISGTNHGSFSDLVLFLPGSSPGIEPARGHEIINALTVAFFDRYL